MRAPSASFRGGKPPLLENGGALLRALARNPLTLPAIALQGGGRIAGDGRARDSGAPRCTVAPPLQG